MSILSILILGLLLVAVLAVGGVTGNLVARDPGYVLVSYDGYSVETSIWFAALLLLAAYFTVRLVLYLLTRLLQSRGMLSRWSANRRTRGAANRTTRGLLLLAEGEWSEAQRALVAAAPNAHSPLMNYLQAARAASALGDSARREALLDAALDSTPGSRLAVGLHRAELQQSNDDWVQSMTTLEELRELSPRHPVVQRLLVKALQHLGRHDRLAEVLPALQKSKALGRAEYNQLAADNAAARLGAAADGGRLQTIYAELAKAVRNTPQVALAFGSRALALDAAGDVPDQAVEASHDRVLFRRQPQPAAAQVAHVALTVAQLGDRVGEPQPGGREEPVGQMADGGVGFQPPASSLRKPALRRLQLVGGGRCREDPVAQ